MSSLALGYPLVGPSVLSFANEEEPRFNPLRFLKKKWMYLYMTNYKRLVKSLVLVFLAFNVLVANPKKLAYTVANPARGLLNREKKRTKKRKSGSVPGEGYTYCIHTVGPRLPRSSPFGS